MLQPHGPILQVGQDIHAVDGEWFDTALRRRMTVVRLADGSLVVHSAIRMSEEALAGLDALGPVGAVVVPNVFHDSDAPFYAARYPGARVYVPAKARAKLARRMRVTGALESDWPFAEELPAIPFRGTLASETAFVHRASRTLILTDMAMNVQSGDFKSAFERQVFGKWNGLLDGFGPSKLARLVLARDPRRVREALSAIAALDFDRVIVSHGRIVETDGKRKLLEGYARIYGEAVRPGDA